MFLKFIFLFIIFISITPLLNAQPKQKAQARKETQKISKYPPAGSKNKEAVKLLNSGIDQTEKQEYELAISAFTKAIELDPKFVHAYNRRGNIYVETKKFNLAVADFTKAMKLDPKEPSPYMYRGNAYLKQEDYESAISDFTKLIEFAPKIFLGYTFRAEAYNKSGKKI